jgi:hypothetical protein
MMRLFTPILDTADWGRNSSFRSPTIISDTGVESASFHSKMRLPLSYRFCFAIHSYSAICACVVAIYGWCSPPAVIRRIWPVIVNSIYLMAIPWFSHVIKEIVKHKPSVTDCDTSASIPFISRIIGVQTPLLDVCPNSINTRTFRAKTMTVPLFSCHTDIITRMGP